MNNIRNLFRISLLSFLVGCCTGGIIQETTSSPSTAAQKNKSNVLEVEKLRQTTVAIVTNTLGLHIPSCSGVWVDADVVLTAAHCADDPDVPFVLISTLDDYAHDKVRPATILASDPEVDLALLTVDTTGLPPHPIARLSTQTPFPGNEVNIIGHTVGLDWTYSHGYVAAIREDLSGPGDKLFKKALQISAPVWMGNSGGGAFDENGGLIGISSWVSKNGPHLAFFVHVDLIELFMVKQLAARSK